MVWGVTFHDGVPNALFWRSAVCVSLGLNSLGLNSGGGDGDGEGEGDGDAARNEHASV